MPRTYADIMTPITAAAEGPLPKCFYQLAAALAALEMTIDQNGPDYLLKNSVGAAIQAATCCVQEYAKTPDQREAEEGLDLAGYPGKWAKAQEYVSQYRTARGAWTYWADVRTCFLELGGGLLSQIPTSDPRHAQHTT